MKRGISIFLVSNVIVQCLIFFQASLDELVYQLARHNYDIALFPIIIFIVSVLFGSFGCNALIRIIKGEY